jgi:peroxin-10
MKRLWNSVLTTVLRHGPLVHAQLSRLHLAIFYCSGRFLELGKRLAGVEHTQMRVFEVARPSYDLFGMLLFIQLAVGAVQTLKSLVDSARASAVAAAAGRVQGVGQAAEPALLLPGLAFQQHQQQPHVHVVPEQLSASGLFALSGGADAPHPHLPHAGGDSLHRLDEGDADDSEGEEEDAPNCPLCLCPRVNPTATECGHLACWECISEACTNKPECPMCRQPCALNTLLRLAHYK